MAKASPIAVCGPSSFQPSWRLGMAPHGDLAGGDLAPRCHRRFHVTYERLAAIGEVDRALRDRVDSSELRSAALDGFLSLISHLMSFLGVNDRLRSRDPFFSFVTSHIRVLDQNLDKIDHRRSFARLDILNNGRVPMRVRTDVPNGTKRVQSLRNVGAHLRGDLVNFVNQPCLTDSEEITDDRLQAPPRKRC